MAQIAVVTGGAGDIGSAIAAKLADFHDVVILVDINESRLDATLAGLQQSSPDGKKKKFTSKLCDVTKADDVKLLAEMAGGLGQIKTLVNNAGATWVGSLHDMTPEAWRAEVSLNLDAAFLCFNAFAEEMKNRETGASVINIASVNGLGLYGNPAYSAAKAGLIHFTKSVAVEYGKFGIRANAVAPGTVRTAAWDKKSILNPKVLEEVKTWYPLGHVAEVDDIANAVAFLASDQATSITGVCLPVDCGLTAGPPPVARAFAVSDHY
jgi:NAD(P)-dependent dehydrogenase (short-subunit alcohol dehydrogenase family)